MSYINKIDIQDGRIIIADMLRRIIEALDGTRNTDIKVNGSLQILKDKLSIDNDVVNVTAGELNGLANRIAGIVEANKPVIVGSNKEVDYMRVNQLAVNQLLQDAPDVSSVTGKIYSVQNFY